MKILIATGIYPPAIGGPAQYAKHVKEEWTKMGHRITVKTFTKAEHALPSLVRHAYYFLKIIPSVVSSDFIFALDTFSVGWPATCAARLFGKKIIMRTGGDFLWEGYVERTRDLVLFKDFYSRGQDKWSSKERKIFKIMKWTLRHVDLLIFSTQWQREVWMNPYDLLQEKTTIVENFYGPKETSYEPTRKDFIAGARPLQWKNIQILADVFSEEEIIKAGATYHKETCPHPEFMEKIARSYASLLVSLGDISPNMILDTIRYNKPFIVTRENGLMDRIAPIAITVDPENAMDIKEKILWLCKKENYDAQVGKIKNFNFTHTWSEIATEILNHYKIL
jgi:hypothetical protein